MKFSFRINFNKQQMKNSPWRQKAWIRVLEPTTHDFASTYGLASHASKSPDP